VITDELRDIVTRNCGIRATVDGFAAASKILGNDLTTEG
jgi:hypothetical protein